MIQRNKEIFISRKTSTADSGFGGSDSDLKKRLNNIRKSGPENGIILTQRMRRELLDTAGTSRTDKTRTTDKTVPSFEMHKAPIKYTIFETNPGANERRFIPFEDMPHCNSKYTRE